MEPTRGTRASSTPTTTRLALLGTIVLAATVATAADQTVLGSKLIVKDPGIASKRSAIGAGKEAASANTIVGNPTMNGAVLELEANGGSSSAQTFSLPQGISSTGKPFWVAVGTKGYKYKDKGENGPVQIVKIQRSSSGTFSIKAVIKAKYGSLSVMPPNPGTDGCLALTIVGGDRYSRVWNAQGTIPTKGTGLVSAKHPTAEGVCPAAPTPTPTFTPSPSPTASCASSNFLDVSNAAGPSYNNLHPSLSASCSANTVTVLSNGIPTYTYMALTPNGLQAKSYTFTFPRFPAIAGSTTNVPLLGNVGVAVNGIPIYGVNEGAMPASDAYGDPIAAAILDECGSHSAQQGTFHNHSLNVKCLVQSAVSEPDPWNDPDPSPNVRSPIIGYAFDGFAIRGPYECTDGTCTAMQKMLSSWDNTGYQPGTQGCSSSASCTNGYCTAVMIAGTETTACVPKTCVWSNNAYSAKVGSAYLDQCNGHLGPLGDYHYHTTTTFPYILGCYTGTPTNNGGNGTPPGGTCP